MNAPNYRFPATCRLLDASAFDAAFRQGTRGADKYFTVCVLTRDDGNARLGIAVSKRNLRRAVDRNRIKRLVRESFRTSAVRGLGLDIVVLPRAAVLQATPERLRHALEMRWDSLRTFMAHRASTLQTAD